MSRRRLHLHLVIATVVVLLATACGSSDEGAAEPVATPSSGPSSTEAPDTSSTADTTVAPTSAASPDEESTTAAPTTAARPSSVSQEPIEIDCASLGRVAVGLQTGSITSGGIEYDYQWTVPSSYDGSPLPVVLDFHGLGGNGAQQAILSGWPGLAEREGFLAVQPTGTAIGRDDRASWELPQFDTDRRDDVAMVRDLLEHIALNVCIDPARVYSTGMSNGGLFTSVLVCELSEVIAAAVSVAGVTHAESCEPTRPVPYLAFHGTADTVIPFRGGGETTLPGSAGGAFFEQVMPEEFAEFASDFGCSEATDVAISDTVTLTSYTGCEAEVELGFYTIDGGGHTWPGSEVSAARQSLAVTTMDVDATALAWDFFQRHALVEE